MASPLMKLLNIWHFAILQTIEYPLYTSQNLIRITQCNSHYKTLKSVVKSKPNCGSGIGFQFYIPGTKENILSRKNVLVKISGIFKKSVLDFKDTAVRL